MVFAPGITETDVSPPVADEVESRPRTNVRRVLYHSQLILLCEWRCPFCDRDNHGEECSCGATIGPLLARRDD